MRSIEEEYFEMLDEQTKYAIFIHDVQRLKMIRDLILRVKSNYLIDKYGLEDKLNKIDKAINRFGEVSVE